MHTSPALITICLSTALASTVIAAEPLALQRTSLERLRQEFYLSLSNITPLDVAPVNVLQFVKQHKDKNQITHIRMQQRYAGFPVFGGYAIMHSSYTPDTMLFPQRKVPMNGTVYRGLALELGQPATDFIARGQQALEQFKFKYFNQLTSPGRVKPLVYIDENNHAHWAYQLSVTLYPEHQVPKKPSAIVDATSLKPFVSWNDIKTLRRPAKGMGFGGNGKTGEYLFGKQYPLLELMRDSQTDRCYMENKAVKVIDMTHSNRTLSETMNFDCKVNPSMPGVFWTGYAGDGYDKKNGAFSPVNDALFAGQIIKQMYHDWYGLPVLAKKDGSPLKLIMRVHYGNSYGNAYWDGKNMTFGDGNMNMYPLVSLGVSAHEISHGFTQQNANLAYFGQSGGINEAFSDMAAQAVDFYLTGKNTWRIGEEIMKAQHGQTVLRYMDEPSRDGHSIDAANKYRKGLDVHYASGVFNRLFYLLANQPSWDTHKAFDVMVKANRDYWTPYTTFVEGACGIMQAAKDLGYALMGVKAALTGVALSDRLC